MAKLKNEEISQGDIHEYLDQEDDFAFEMEVLTKMDQLNFVCEHGGTYIDPITEKRREFDIRCEKEEIVGSKDVRFLFAIECKNIRPNFPLVASCVERTDAEAFHDLLVFKSKVTTSDPFGISQKSDTLNYPVKVTVTDGHSYYRAGQLVAKKLNQVGRALDGKIVGNDGSVFDKMTQALNSAYGLICRAAREKGSTQLRAIVPLLVVPDNILWQVTYARSGHQIGKAERTGRIPLFVNQSWWIDQGLANLSFALSHMEVVSYSTIEKWFEDLVSSEYNIFSGLGIA